MDHLHIDKDLIKLLTFTLNAKFEYEKVFKAILLPNQSIPK